MKTFVAIPTRLYADTPTLLIRQFKAENIDKAVIIVQNYFDMSYAWEVKEKV